MHMKNRIVSKYFSSIGIIIAIAFWPATVMAAPSGPACVIDFEGLPKGTVITELSAGSGISGCAVNGVVSVESSNSIFSNEAAVVFDSDCTVPCVGKWKDSDLGSPNETFGGPGVGLGGEMGMPQENDTAHGMIGILVGDKIDDSPADGLVDDPDDADVPGEFRFDFSGINNKGVTIGGVTIMDVEFDQNENPAEVIMLRSGKAPSIFTLIDTGDNGVATIADVGLENVEQLIVKVKGSAGLSSVVFGVEKRACWVTFGGFDSAFVGSEGQKIASFGGNVGPPPSGHLNIVRHTDGSHLIVPNAEVVSCERDETVCPNSGNNSPGQPGGKKGFDINVLNFSGVGSLKGPDGTTSSVQATGKLIDCGEPAGKKDRDPDQFHVFTDGALFVGDVLGGGNVQLHPPVPSN